MPTVTELTEPFGAFLISPQPGPGVCAVCFNLTDGFDRCWACTHGGDGLDAVAPISYSVSGGPLSEMLAAYKRDGGARARLFEIGLAAVLWRYLEHHERCVGHAAAVPHFDIVTTVPSSDRERDEAHPLRRMVTERVKPARERYRRVLRRSRTASDARRFDPGRYEAVEPISGDAVLLLDDTWTTGANAHSAAAALKRAGAGPVAAVVIGRHLNREWRSNEERLAAMPRGFDWERCALDAEPAAVNH